MAKPVQTEHLYVQKVPGVCGGDQVVKGTRIPVRLIYQRSKAGDSVEKIKQAYPHLTLAQIHDALSYAYDHLADIEAEIRREEDAFDQGEAGQSR